jgi:hypothetical protein
MHGWTKGATEYERVRQLSICDPIIRNGDTLFDKDLS